jgi:hypothetical protein
MARGDSRRLAVALAGAVAIAAAAVGCSADPDPQASVATVDFQPRLVVVAGDQGLRAEPGPRAGAAVVHGDGADEWKVPDGTVVEVRVEGSRPQRVTAERTRTTGGDPTPLLDTGELQPGDVVVVGLTELGQVAFGEWGEEPTLTVGVVPRGSTSTGP